MKVKAQSGTKIDTDHRGFAEGAIARAVERAVFQAVDIMTREVDVSLWVTDRGIPCIVVRIGADDSDEGKVFMVPIDKLARSEAFALRNCEHEHTGLIVAALRQAADRLEK